MKVAIDGPAGSGKSTVAKALSSRRGLMMLDTGAMYRCVTLACHESGTSVADDDAVAELARGLDIAFATAEDGSQRVIMDGRDVSEQIRTAEVDADVSAVSAIPAVREAMVAQQRTLAGTHDVVAEGRDIGTVVFPDAEVKVFLTADVSARAHRRAVQRNGQDAAVDPTVTADAEMEEQIRQDLERRDQADSSREVAPLKPADDAHHIDSSDLTVEEVVNQICELMDAAAAGTEQPATEGESKAKPEPEPESESKPEAKPEPEPTTEPEAKPESEAKPKKAAVAKKAKDEKKTKEGPLHVFGHNTLEDYYEHPIREFPITSRALLAASIIVCGAVSKVFWHWTLENGEELWNAKGGQMVIMNHISMLDPIIIVVSGWAHGRRMRPIYKSEFDKHRFVTWFFARVGALPVKRGTADIKVVRRAQRALQNGEDVVIFPEGTRIRPGDTNVEIHGGFALIAQLAKAPVLPVAIVGASDGAPGGAKSLRPCRVWMRAGKAITFDELNVKGRKKRAEAMEKVAMDRVYALRDALRAEHPGRF